MTDYREVIINDNNETRNNLFEELERIAKAVKNFGGVWWSSRVEGKPAHQINSLVVTANGSIAAAGWYDVPMHEIHPIYINDDGFPVISEWDCDPTLMRKSYDAELDDPSIMLDPHKWRSAPAFMVYYINTGDYTVRNEAEMLRKYQNSLDDVRDGIEGVKGNSFAALINSWHRIGGKYVNCEL